MITYENNSTLLNLSLERGIISADDLLDDLEMLIKNKILKSHKYEVFFSDSDQRWHSYLPDSAKKNNRKPIARKKRVDLENCIVDFYMPKANDTVETPALSVKNNEPVTSKAPLSAKSIVRPQASTQTKPEESAIIPEITSVPSQDHDTLERKTDRISLKDLYPQWRTYKALETSWGNVSKLDWIWEKHLEKTLFSKRDISEMKVIELKEWFLKVIEKKSLTNRQYKDLKSLLNMLFDYAIEKDFISHNISRNIKRMPYKKFLKKEKKEINEQIFFQDEASLVTETALEMFSKTRHLAYLGIALNFYLALRVGELVALKTTDIENAILHVQRQEIAVFEDKDGKTVRNGYTLSKYTKSLDSDRYIPIMSKAQHYIDMIVTVNKERGYKSEFLFLQKDGSRMHTEPINTALRRVNKKVKVKQKGNHSIRKTCLSNMNASKELTDEEIRVFAGHKEVSTTQNSYFFATETYDTRRSAYERAICG